MADWAKSSGVKQVLFISSAGIYKPTEEPPHVEGVTSLFQNVPLTNHGLLDMVLSNSYYRMLLKPMLVMLGLRNTYQRISAAGRFSVHNT